MSVNEQQHLDTLRPVDRAANIARLVLDGEGHVVYVTFSGDGEESDFTLQYVDITPTGSFTVNCRHSGTRSGKWLPPVETKGTF